MITRIGFTYIPIHSEVESRGTARSDRRINNHDSICLARVGNTCRAQIHKLLSDTRKKKKKKSEFGYGMHINENKMVNNCVQWIT